MFLLILLLCCLALAGHNNYHQKLASACITSDRCLSEFAVGPAALVDGRLGKSIHDVLVAHGISRSVEDAIANTTDTSAMVDFLLDLLHSKCSSSDVDIATCRADTRNTASAITVLIIIGGIFLGFFALASVHTSSSL
jgi:hypothetical protein